MLCSWYSTTTTTCNRNTTSTTKWNWSWINKCNSCERKSWEWTHSRFRLGCLSWLNAMYYSNENKDLIVWFFFFLAFLVSTLIINKIFIEVFFCFDIRTKTISCRFLSFSFWREKQNNELNWKVFISRKKFFLLIIPTSPLPTTTLGRHLRK